jgi:catechol 2,3-dioxygenase-like lactoylglutathione lyase family enzyme
VAFFFFSTNGQIFPIRTGKKILCDELILILNQSYFLEVFMNPILNQIGTVFIPVSNIEEARNWYCDILCLASEGEILFGHLFIVPMNGTGIVLDSRIFSDENIFKAPLFHFNTNNIENAYEYMMQKKVEITTGIENNQWFNFKDPDGNHLMVCEFKTL